MCFIYINDIPEGIKSISKILADDTSLFSIVKWAHQWKMLFNHDSRKKATEVYFSRRLNQVSLPLGFNDNTFEIVEVHEHLGYSLDKKLDFNTHIDNKINKCNKITRHIETITT